MRGFRSEWAATLRRWRRAPVFPLVATAVLAVAIGASVAAWSAAAALFWGPLPFPRAGELFLVGEASPAGPGADVGPVPAPVAAAWAKATGPWRGISSWRPWVIVVTAPGPPRLLYGAAVSRNFFSVLRASPARGGILRGHAPQVVLSAVTARDLFPDGPVGREIETRRGAMVVAGTLPPGFLIPGQPGPVAFIVPMPPAPAGVVNYVRVLMRLRDAAAARSAVARLADIQRRLPGTTGAFAGPAGVPMLMSARRAISGPYRRRLLALSAATLALLLIACGNLCGLLLTRTVDRVEEIELRKALGAPKFALLLSASTEGLAVALAGGLVGGVVALLALRAMPALGVPASRAGAPVPSVAAAATLITALMAVAPAAWATRSRPRLRLQRTPGRTLRVLVVAQLALATAATVAVVLLTRSAFNLVAIRPGFALGETFVARTAFPTSDAAESTRLLLARLRALPQVKAAAIMDPLPLRGFSQTAPVHVTGGFPVDAAIGVSSAGALRLLGVALRDGRYFSEQDRFRSRPVAILNAQLAALLFPRQRPIGHRIWTADRALTVVGIVAGFHQLSLRQPEQPELFLPLAQAAPECLCLVVTPRPGDAASLPQAIRSAIAAALPADPVTEVSSLHSLIASETAVERAEAGIFGALGTLALVLACLGAFGAAADTVQRRKKEFAIRKALGASAAGIVATGMGPALRDAAAGCGAGLALAAVLTGHIQGLLVQVAAHDPASFLLGGAAVFLAAAVAAALPTARGALVLPTASLREN